jgi:hypothetical protein
MLLLFVFFAISAERGLALRPVQTLPSARLSSQLFGGGILRGDHLPSLISMASESQRGLLRSRNAEIIELIEAIASDQKKYMSKVEKIAAKKAALDGKWEAIWTTEKETLFFCSSGLFGKPVSRVLQVIDTAGSSINNIIEFEDNRAFSVIGSINLDQSTSDCPDGTCRVEFAFKSAELRIPPFPSLTLPPVGKGWFDNLYVNEKYRLSRDIRGDYLISKRIS